MTRYRKRRSNRRRLALAFLPRPFVSFQSRAPGRGVSMPASRKSSSIVSVALFAAGLALAAGLPLAAEQETQTPPPPQTAPARPCRVIGHITSGADALVGVTVT